MPPSKESIACAVEALRADQVVAYPTETVYGLAVNPFSRTAIKALYEAKGRPDNKPVLLIVADMTQLEKVVRNVSSRAERYIEAYWPGPLSMLFERSPDLPFEVTAGLDKVCVRCPACNIARGLCQAFGGALTSSSANASGKEPVRSLVELDLPGVKLGIDGGVLEPNLPSTLYDPDLDKVLREGALTETELRAVRGQTGG